MRYLWSLRWTLYPKAIGLCAFQVELTMNRQEHDANKQDNKWPLMRKESCNPVPRLCARLRISEVLSGSGCTSGDQMKNTAEQQVLSGFVSSVPVGQMGFEALIYANVNASVFKLSD